MATTRVIGVGNAWRSDDGAGLAVAARLREFTEAFEVLEESGEGASLMEAWSGADSVVVVDAARGGASPGTVYRFDATTDSIPSGFLHYSTHAFGVAEAIELARALGTLPPRLVLYGIEGGSFEAGLGLTEQVGAAVERVVGRIRTECESSQPESPPCTSIH